MNVKWKKITGKDCISLLTCIIIFLSHPVFFENRSNIRSPYFYSHAINCLFGYTSFYSYQISWHRPNTKGHNYKCYKIKGIKIEKKKVTKTFRTKKSREYHGNSVNDLRRSLSTLINLLSQLNAQFPRQCKSFFSPRNLLCFCAMGISS